jgi:FKBP-type peptidyl-prolyl cis-trans isomerase SlyD
VTPEGRPVCGICGGFLFLRRLFLMASLDPNPNRTVEDGMVVSIDYTLRLDEDDDVVDSSESGEPLQFVQGQGQIIPGLEQQLYGMSIGDEKSVVVAPAEGYGEADPDAYQVVPLEAFPGDMVVEPGMGLQMRDNSGQTFEAYVADVRPDGIVLDFNHPLAGKTLHFDVRITGLREATADEQAHGHVHDGGHTHEDEEDDEE